MTDVRGHAQLPTYLQPSQIKSLLMNLVSIYLLLSFAMPSRKISISKPLICNLCADIFSHPDDVTKVLNNEPLTFQRAYHTLVQAESSGCKLCALLVSVINSSPTVLGKDGTIVPGEDPPGELDITPLDTVECQVTVEGSLLHTLRVTCRVEQRRDRFTFLGISAHKGRRLPLKILTRRDKGLTLRRRSGRQAYSPKKCSSQA